MTLNTLIKKLEEAQEEIGEALVTRLMSLFIGLLSPIIVQIITRMSFLLS